MTTSSSIRVKAPFGGLVAAASFMQIQFLISGPLMPGFTMVVPCPAIVPIQP
jgi:hypothetical protein